ncbi:YokU family protein [Bacillus methanolicus]|uniref:YokU family protein n=1 Tax=Bacillus methanolicus TaxID=1471 RepID=UPI00237FFBFD|nr:YokU family protein [Bacillus methanolicus]MDE3839264.1 YokU family protein [Bacillus methanolicus]
MEENCLWCQSKNITKEKTKVYWELPDGTKAIEISETPSISCHDCQMVYQSDDTVKEIENQLFIINTRLLGKSVTYHELMNMPKLLKRNYFDFLS